MKASRTLTLSFEEFLHSSLNKKKLMDKRYSLRHFAHDLDVSPTYLSLILNGKKRPSEKFILHVSETLGEGFERVNQWVSKAKDKRPYFEYMSAEDFSKIAQWYNYAIIESFKLSDFPRDVKSTPKALSELYDLDLKTIRQSLKKLQELNIIQQKKDQWVLVKESNTSLTPSEATSQIKRNFQKQILNKAIQAIEDHSTDVRHNSSVTFAIDDSKIEKARELIKKFRQDMSLLLTHSAHLNKVYNLAIALYPVSEDIFEVDTPQERADV